MNNSRYITVKIDELTMQAILAERWNYWLSSPEDKEIRSIYEQFTDFLVEEGYFYGSEFNPELIVDNLYINDTSLYDSVEDAVKDGYQEGDIAYIDEDSGCVLVWA